MPGVIKTLHRRFPHDNEAQLPDFAGPKRVLTICNLTVTQACGGDSQTSATHYDWREFATESVSAQHSMQ